MAAKLGIVSVAVDPAGGRVITWASEGGAYYSVLRSTDLMAGDAGFQVLPGAKAIVGVPPQNTFTDAEELLGPVFYRVIPVDNPDPNQ
jgi:hypothetical protein